MQPAGKRFEVVQGVQQRAERGRATSIESARPPIDRPRITSGKQSTSLNSACTRASGPGELLSIQQHPCRLFCGTRMRCRVHSGMRAVRPTRKLCSSPPIFPFCRVPVFPSPPCVCAIPALVGRRSCRSCPLCPLQRCLVPAVIRHTRTGETEGAHCRGGTHEHGCGAVRCPPLGVGFPRQPSGSPSPTGAVAHAQAIGSSRPRPRALC
jgi:hypothetical protein